MEQKKSATPQNAFFVVELALRDNHTNGKKRRSLMRFPAPLDQTKRKVVRESKTIAINLTESLLQ